MLTVARSNIVNDGALVAFRPGVPVERQLRAGSGSSVESAGSCALVAVDIVGTGGGGLNKSVVLVQGSPASCLRPRIGRAVEPHRVSALSPGTVAADIPDMAVGRCCVKKGGDDAENECCGKHVVVKV